MVGPKAAKLKKTSSKKSPDHKVRAFLLPLSQTSIPLDISLAFQLLTERRKVLLAFTRREEATVLSLLFFSRRHRLVDTIQTHNHQTAVLQGHAGERRFV